jgi:hypothetical protein
MIVSPGSRRAKRAKWLGLVLAPLEEDAFFFRGDKSHGLDFGEARVG